VLLVPLTFIAIGGFCVAAFAWTLKGKPLTGRAVDTAATSNGHS
jgi:hypothetical protein